METGRHYTTRLDIWLGVPPGCSCAARSTCMSSSSVRHRDQVWRKALRTVLKLMTSEWHPTASWHMENTLNMYNKSTMSMTIYVYINNKHLNYKKINIPIVMCIWHSMTVYANFYKLEIWHLIEYPGFSTIKLSNGKRGSKLLLAWAGFKMLWTTHN